MTLLDWRRTFVRRSGVVLLLVGAMLLLVACGGSNGETDPEEEPEVVETAAPSGPTSTPEPTAEPTGTATPAATNTPEPTPTTTSTPTPEPPTPTPTITPTPSPTPLPTRDNPFGNVVQPGESVPNFTLNYAATFDGADAESSVELFIAQARPDSYHLRVVSAGQQTEAWRVGEVIYVLGPGGAVVELPGLVDQNLYAPSTFLFLVPNLADIDEATIIDEDADVAGRAATHYQLDPETANAFLPPQSEAGTDVEGTFDVWVDNELNVISRMEADIEWSAGGGDQSMQMQFQLSEVGLTPEAQPPQ